MNLRLAYRFSAPAILALAVCLPGCSFFNPMAKKSATSQATAQNGTGTDTTPTMPPIPGGTPNTKPNPIGPIPIAKRTLDANDLRNLYLSYMDVANNGRPPKNLEELNIKQDQKLYQAVADKSFVLYWNVNFNNLPAGSSNTVLGYSADIQIKNASVLMADGSVQTMTPEDFKKA